MSLTAGGLALAVILLYSDIRTQLLGDRSRGAGDRTKTWKALGIGIISAFILYGIFWAGNILAQRLFGFAASDIESVYDFKSGTPVWIIGLLIACIIGPAEEIFWRGFVQSRISMKMHKWGWILAAFIYAGVHLASVNVMLVLAALICGLFWGWLYHRFQSLHLNIISHVVWDLMVFLLLPFHQVNF